MRLGIRGKLFAGSFGLIILSLLASELYLRPAIEANLLDRIRADLYVRLALVQRAPAGGAQTSTRFSATIGKRLMYAAVPLALPGARRGVARLAVPIDEVTAAV